MSREQTPFPGSAMVAAAVTAGFTLALLVVLAAAVHRARPSSRTAP